MTDNTQELDEILDTLAEKSADSDSRLGYVDAYVFAQEAKQAILDWHNKQIEVVKSNSNQASEVKRNSLNKSDRDVKYDEPQEIQRLHTHDEFKEAKRVVHIATKLQKKVLDSIDKKEYN